MGTQSKVSWDKRLVEGWEDQGQVGSAGEIWRIRKAGSIHERYWGARMQVGSAGDCWGPGGFGRIRGVCGVCPGPLGNGKLSPPFPGTRGLFSAP